VIHIPVLKNEVLKYLDPKPNENFIDCTIGEAGHTLAIIEKILPNGKLLGIDWSPELIQALKFKIQKSKIEFPFMETRGKKRTKFSSPIKNNLIFVCDNFAHLKEIVKRKRFEKVSGILFDLGISSWHLQDSSRGFSFLRNEPLDMRYNTQSPLTAEKILNYWSGIEIEKILKEYGQEKFARRIAREIINQRKVGPIKTTFQLVRIVKQATPSWYHHRKIHFATKTFLALRIGVNDELLNLEKVLPQALEILEKGGRLVVISFHSLEDKIVKNFFKNQEKAGFLKILTKKPIKPSKEEVKINPRSRSAKLRAGQKI